MKDDDIIYEMDDIEEDTSKYIGDGKMNREQAKVEAEKIFIESARKSEQIIKDAKENGTWKAGLDSYNDLFNELEEETKKRLIDLEKKIDK